MKKNIQIILLILTIIGMASIAFLFIQRETAKVAKTLPNIEDYLNQDDSVVDSRDFFDDIETAMSDFSSRIVNKDSSNWYLDYIVDEVARFETDDTLILFYTAEESAKSGALVVGKFDIRIVSEGQIQYRMRRMTYFERGTGKSFGTNESLVRNFLLSSLTLQDYNINEDTLFVWGNCINDSVYSLEIEGQKPTKIIEYEILGMTQYFWYYENLIPGDEGLESWDVEIDE